MKHITLILLTLCSLITSSEAQIREIYVLPGLGRQYYGAPRAFSGNFGMRVSPYRKHFYFNAGISLLYLKDQWTNNPKEEGYMVEFAGGPGFRHKAGRFVFKVGCDIGFMYSLNGVDNYVAYMPQGSATFITKKKLEIGLFLKANMPFRAPALYKPQFLGGGLLFRF